MMDDYYRIAHDPNATAGDLAGAIEAIDREIADCDGGFRAQADGLL